MEDVRRDFFQMRGRLFTRACELVDIAFDPEYGCTWSTRLEVRGSSDTWYRNRLSTPGDGQIITIERTPGHLEIFDFHVAGANSSRLEMAWFDRLVRPCLVDPTPVRQTLESTCTSTTIISS
jgi:hypothetical protein